MTRQSGAMHVAKITNRRVNKAGEMRTYESVFLRRSVRDGSKVRHETLANLSALPAAAVAVLAASLAGKTLLVAGENLQITRSLPHGHVAAVTAIAKQLDFPQLLGPAGRHRDVVLALITARICRPVSKLATTRWFEDSTLAEDYGLHHISTDEVYAALDWLGSRQQSIEKKLASRYLTSEANPHRLALFDLSSSWVTGHHCPLAKRGYSRDGKKGLPQIEYGLLTDAEGRPIAIRVEPGNTADPTAFTTLVQTMKDDYGLEKMVMTGDRGMITSARIRQLREHDGLGWITALRSTSIAALLAGPGPLQQSLFDDTNLAEISSPDYPGERLIACRNPALAERRTAKRLELLAATETQLATIQASVDAGRLSGAGPIGVRVGKVIGRHNMGKHLILAITDTTFTVQRNQNTIDTEALLDGLYVIRTSVPQAQMDSDTVVATYKSLARVERDFRSMKADDLDLRPIYHWTETRVRAHVFLCMLAAHLVWHLRKAWAPLTYTDEARPVPADPVAPAKRSPKATIKAQTHTTATGTPAYDFPSLLAHLGTLTRNRIHLTDTDQTVDFDLLAIPTATQRAAFELLDAPIPTTHK